MSEKKLTQEELAQASGGAKFSLSAQKAENAEQLGESARGVILDPLGGPSDLLTAQRASGQLAEEELEGSIGGKATAPTGRAFDGFQQNAEKEDLSAQSAGNLSSMTPQVKS